MPFDRKIFFDSVRASLFSGSLSQQQVDGMEFKLRVWERAPFSDDQRWLAYPFATSYHETGQRMWPIREGFKTTDAEARKYVAAQGYAYAKPDPVTGEVYYGRGDVQMTWADNYKKATTELSLSGSNDLYRYPEQALDPQISADAMYHGMVEGWYRASSDGKRQTLARYFSNTKDDAYGAREIINGDKSKVPSWSGGVSIGKLIAGYHNKFLAALEAAWVEEPAPEPEPEPAPPVDIGPVRIDIQTPPGVRVSVAVNGEIVAG